MKSRFIPCIICLFQTVNLLGQGTVNFSNIGDGRVTNGLTGQPLAVGTNYVVHLFYAPIFVPPGEVEAAMIPLPPPAFILVPGLFAGGVRITPPTTPGGAPAFFQVRVWDTSLGATWEEALAAWRQDTTGTKLLGKSAVILVQQTGDNAALPPTPPANLVRAGLQGFSVNPFVNLPPHAVASIQPVADLPGTTGRLIISGNNSDALVALDGSASSDDGTIASYSWFVAGASEPFATGATTPAVFGLGAHDVRLVVVDDGGLPGEAAVVFDVITAAEAVTAVLAYLEAQSLPEDAAETLAQSLSQAAGFFQSGKFDQALQRLEVLQNQLRDDLEAEVPDDLAAVLDAAAQTIIDHVQFQRANNP